MIEKIKNILDSYKSNFKDKSILDTNIKDRILYLLKCIEDDEFTEFENLEKSLESMLWMFLLLGNFNMPSITLSEDGYFHASWGDMSKTGYREIDKNKILFVFREDDVKCLVIRESRIFKTEIDTIQIETKHSVIIELMFHLDKNDLIKYWNNKNKWFT